VRWFLNRLGLVEGFQRNDFEGEPMRGHKTWIGGASLTRQLIEQLEHDAARPGYYFIHYLDSHAPFHAGGRRGGKFARYLRALRVVDGFVGEVRAAIERLGLSERVLLIVTSDHGEAFGEHHSSFHGGTLYDELVRVPLAVVGPGVAQRQIDTPVSLIDLGPTVLDWFGVPTPAAFMGESLVPLLRGQERSFQRPIVSETGLKQAMLFADGRKVIRDLRRQTLELYDLGVDPGELVNLSDDVDPDQEEHVLSLRGFFQTHTYRENGYRVPYVK
jgi:arylsulfatase A-like enzyme